MKDTSTHRPSLAEIQVLHLMAVKNISIREIKNAVQTLHSTDIGKIEKYFTDNGK